MFYVKFIYNKKTTKTLYGKHIILSISKISIKIINFDILQSCRKNLLPCYHCYFFCSVVKSDLAMVVW